VFHFECSLITWQEPSPGGTTRVWPPTCRETSCSGGPPKSVRRTNTRSPIRKPEITGPGSVGTEKAMGMARFSRSRYCSALAQTSCASAASSVACSVGHHMKKESKPRGNRRGRARLVGITRLASAAGETLTGRQERRKPRSPRRSIDDHDSRSGTPGTGQLRSALSRAPHPGRSCPVAR